MTTPYSPGSAILLKRIEKNLAEARSFGETLPLAVNILVDLSHDEEEKEQLFQRILELAAKGRQTTLTGKEKGAAAIGHLQETAETMESIEHEAAHLLQFTNDIDAYIQSNMIYNWRWLLEALVNIDLIQFKQAVVELDPGRRQVLVDILSGIEA